jgi:hypothetical protein
VARLAWLGSAVRGRRCLMTSAAALAFAVTGAHLAAAENNSQKTVTATQTAASAMALGAGMDADVATTLQQQQEMLQEQARQLQEQALMLSKQQEMLRQQQQQIDALQRQSEPGVKPAAVGVPRVGSGWYYPAQEVVPVPPEPEVTPVPPQDGEEPGAPAEQGPTAAEEERPESEKPTDQLLLERGAILLPAGTLQIEPSIEYTHISANQVAISGFTIFDAIVIGNIEVDDLNRDIFTGSIAARYGIHERVQIDARVPYLFRRDAEIFGFGTNNQEYVKTNNHGLGDVEAGLSVQPLIGDGVGIPDIIVRGHGRFPTGEDPFDIATLDLGNGRSVLEEPPTGSGFYGVGGGGTFVWRVDPVVFFAGADATFNLARTFTGFGEIDPGDTYQLFGGVNVQLSELVSLNLSFVDQYTTKTVQNDITIDGTEINDARLVLGTAVGVGQNASLTFNAAAGLTDESPDFVFTISLPVSFSLL